LGYNDEIVKNVLREYKFKNYKKATNSIIWVKN
jgi:hypothetical protein